MPEADTIALLNKLVLPSPSIPVPVVSSTFPSIAESIRHRRSGSAEAAAQKINALRNLGIAPLVNWLTPHPDNIHIDGTDPIGLVDQPRHEMLAVASGGNIRLVVEEVPLGFAFSITQFQTRRFGTRNSLSTNKREMLSRLGFFDWKALLIEYYKQSYAYLREVDGIYTPYLAVKLYKHAQQDRMLPLYRLSSHTSSDTIERETQRLVQEEFEYLASLGFDLIGNHSNPFTAVAFMDVRDIRLNPEFAKCMDQNRGYRNF